MAAKLSIFRGCYDISPTDMISTFGEAAVYESPDTSQRKNGVTCHEEVCTTESIVD